MGIYQDRILPRIQDMAMSRKSGREVRARVCAGGHGDVVEIGFGTGLNAPYYPPEVTMILAIEPSAVCLRIAEPRIARSTVAVVPAGLNGEQLDIPSEKCDAALSTWTLCTIPDLTAALTEVRRVLKPGGALHFVEHGHAPDPKVERWQRRFEPLNKRLAGGCHLTRHIPALIEEAGFAVEKLDTYYFKSDPKPLGYTFEGRAVKR
ncbi:MAG TPA: class I SAM-dependent methyltransferase [Chloroflexota bacterium]|jgi:ubiquinone/menaquinone biosynthesis C-methylase UbiE|nr:class I SAM-dependent methyltransferase [Chloroflexota bacterium]